MVKSIGFSITLCLFLYKFAAANPTKSEQLYPLASRLGRDETSIDAEERLLNASEDDEVEILKEAFAEAAPEDDYTDEVELREQNNSLKDNKGSGDPDDIDPDDDDVLLGFRIGDNSTNTNSSEICMKKVVMVEQTEFDEELQCHIARVPNCFTTSKITYKPVQIEKCQDRFIKVCTIEYRDESRAKEVEVCHDSINRNCSITGDIICSKQYETVCSTEIRHYQVEDDVVNCNVTYIRQCMMNGTMCADIPVNNCNKTTEENTKGVPQTECDSVPKEVCGPEQCPIVSDRVCNTEIRHQIIKVPDERCNFTPQNICEMETKLIPKTENVNNCVDVDKEVCVNVRVRPRKVRKPEVRLWCGDPNAQPSTTSSPITSPSPPPALLPPPPPPALLSPPSPS